MEGFGNHIVQYSPEYSLCAGCEACSIMCGLVHEGYTGPLNARIKLNLGTRSMIHEVLSCQQCDDHPCYEACPLQDKAMNIDADTGIVYVDESFCVGCGLCVKACKFDPPRISIRKSNVKRGAKAVKCDLCRDNPEGPQCIKYCQVACIGLSDASALREDGWWPVEAAKAEEEK